MTIKTKISNPYWVKRQAHYLILFLSFLLLVVFFSIKSWEEKELQKNKYLYYSQLIKATDLVNGPPWKIEKGKTYWFVYKDCSRSHVVSGNLDITSVDPPVVEIRVEHK